MEAIRDLAGRAEPDASVAGVVIASVSLLVMPFLGRAKRTLAPVLGSAAADAAQTNLCALLSGVLLIGLCARLVVDHAEGTRRVYRLDPAGLQDLREQLDRFWNAELVKFKQLVEQPEEEA